MRSAWLTALALALATPTAVAASTPPPPPDLKPDRTPADKEEARRLFNNAIDLQEGGAPEAAIAAYRSAFVLTGKSACLYNIAQCYGDMGDYEAAIIYMQYFRAYAKDDELEGYEEDLARYRELKAEADAEREARADDVDDKPKRPRPQPAPVEDDVEPRPRVPLFTPAAIAATVIGAVGLGVGTGLGVASIRRKNDASEACELDPDGDRFCRGDAKQNVDAGRRLAIGADISLGIGAAGAAAAVVIVAIQASRNRRARVAMTPRRGGAGLSVRF